LKLPEAIGRTGGAGARSEGREHHRAVIRWAVIFAPPSPPWRRQASDRGRETFRCTADCWRRIESDDRVLPRSHPRRAIRDPPYFLGMCAFVGVGPFHFETGISLWNVWGICAGTGLSVTARCRCSRTIACV